jgi:hypothetical protein
MHIISNDATHSRLNVDQGIKLQIKGTPVIKLESMFIEVFYIVTN